MVTEWRCGDPTAEGPAAPCEIPARKLYDPPAEGPTAPCVVVLTPKIDPTAEGPVVPCDTQGPEF